MHRDELECSSQKQQRVYFSDYSLIQPGLFIGNEEIGKDLESLQLLMITHILVVGSQLDIHYPQHFKYKKISVKDSLNEDISKHLQSAIDFIRQGISQGAILVHCKFGISRSTSVVIAYLMRQRKLTTQQAYNIVRGKRSVTQPNSNFLHQLRIFEKKLQQ